MSELNGFRSKSWYDCVALATDGYGDLLSTHSIRIFGNSNVGNLNLTNLQVPGQFQFEGSFIVQRWYARTNIQREWNDVWPQFMAAMNTSHATFIMGDKPQWQMAISELLDRRPRRSDEEPQHSRVWAGDPWPLVVPERQFVNVTLDLFGSADALRTRLLEYVTYEFTPRLWIHLEGVSVPDDEDGRRLLDALLNTDRQRRSVEENIVNWLAGMVASIDEDAAKAQVLAIADGILSGRARSS